jgi:hypothetical protein
LRLIAADVSLFTHQLELLLRLTARRDVLRQNQHIWRQFVRVNRWVPAWRYDPNIGQREEAESFLEAVDDILTWVRNNI